MPGGALAVSLDTLALVTVSANALESRNPYAAGHGWRVSPYAADVGRCRRGATALGPSRGPGDARTQRGGRRW